MKKLDNKCTDLLVQLVWYTKQIEIELDKKGNKNGIVVKYFSAATGASSALVNVSLTQPWNIY